MAGEAEAEAVGEAEADAVVTECLTATPDGFRCPPSVIFL